MIIFSPSFFARKEGVGGRIEEENHSFLGTKYERTQGLGNKGNGSVVIQDDVSQVFIQTKKKERSMLVGKDRQRRMDGQLFQLWMVRWKTWL